MIAERGRDTRVYVAEREKNFRGLLTNLVEFD